MCCSLFQLGWSFFLGVGGPRAPLGSENAQLTCIFVINEELARHGTLVVEHVNQEAQRPQIAAQLFECAGLVCVRNLIDEQTLHGVAHAQHRQRCLIQSQHRQYATHLRQEAGYSHQQRGFLRTAEKLIHRLFGLSEGGAQLIHHAAHRLVVADTAVQLFHPGFQRLRLCTRSHRIQPLGQTGRPLDHLVICGIQLFKGCLQIQHRCRHFHGQSGRWWLARAGDGIQGFGQCDRQALAARVELAQRIANQAELICSRFDLVAIATRQGRPCLRSRGNAFASLRQQCGVETTKTHRFVIHRLETVQRECVPHSLQSGRARTIHVLRLRAEKQEILNQPICHRFVTLGKGGILHQHTRGNAFDVDIWRQQTFHASFKEACTNLPESTYLAVLLGCHEPQAGVTHTARRLAVTGLHNLEHSSIKTSSGICAIEQRRCGHLQIRFLETPLYRPQVCRVNSIRTRKSLDIAVLGKQGHRRDRLACQHAFQIFDQSKAGTFNDGG